MKKPSLKASVEPKKLALLGVLVAVLAVVWWINRTPDTPGPSRATPAAAGGIVPAPPVRPQTRAQTARPALATRQGQRGGAPQEFRPSLKPKDQAIDPTKVDPTLKLVMLAKLQKVEIEGGQRSLFEFSSPPPPPKPKVDPIKPGPVATVAVQPPDPATTTPAKPATPPAAPIPLKFYGFVTSTRSGAAKSAFFLEGEEIFVAREGELIRNRYKIVRIGVNSAVVEDTDSKSQQTLKLVEEVAG